MLATLVICFLLFVLSSFLLSNGKSLYEVRKCSNSVTNQEGICVSVYDCSWALDRIRKREYVTNCDFMGRVPIVCCPRNHITDEDVLAETPLPIANESEAPIWTDDRVGNISVSPANVGQRSQEKCDEYYPRVEGFHTVAVGGEQSLAKEFPHMAILGYGNEDEKQWKCGGSLISLQHILTAAHCLSSRDFGGVKFVRLGDLNIANDKDDAEPQDFTVKSSIGHPDYDSRTVKNDIAILELDREVKVTDYVKPACLFLGDGDLEYQEITATGWGITEFGGDISNDLIKVQLQIFDDDACLKQYKNVGARGELDRTKQVCAGSSQDEKIMDTCQGDSGGPLQLLNYTVRKHFNIIGVTSFGKACGITNSAGVYTRVSHYIPWIESILFGN